MQSYILLLKERRVVILLSGLYLLAGPYCNRTWDGWLCWSDVAAGTVSVQRCPDYFQDFNPSGKSAWASSSMYFLIKQAFRVLMPPVCPIRVITT